MAKVIPDPGPGTDEILVSCPCGTPRPRPAEPGSTRAECSECGKKFPISQLPPVQRKILETA